MSSGLQEPTINAHAELSSDASNPEVVAVKRRRSISPSEKRRILLAYDRCKTGERGALLRQERVYSSMLTNWRKQLAVLDQAALTVRRGPKGDYAKPGAEGRTAAIPGYQPSKVLRSSSFSVCVRSCNSQ